MDERKDEIVDEGKETPRYIRQIDGLKVQVEDIYERSKSLEIDREELKQMRWQFILNYNKASEALVDRDYGAFDIACVKCEIFKDAIKDWLDDHSAL